MKGFLQVSQHIYLDIPDFQNKVKCLKDLPKDLQKDIKRAIKNPTNDKTLYLGFGLLSSISYYTDKDKASWGTMLYRIEDNNSLTFIGADFDTSD